MLPMDIKERSAVIIVDTGYSLESMKSVQNILAVMDVRNGSVVTGFPYLTWEHNEDALTAFAGDPYNHGSMVLESLTKQAPHLPVILIRAYDNNRLLRTTFKNGRIARPGWTEAYLTAVHICKSWGLSSVANLSFGGYTHAADGSGWESFCLGSVTGPGKPGHVIVAGAASGAGDAIHSSWRTEPGQTSEVSAYQSRSATYNFWCSAASDSPQFNDWLVEFFLNDEKIAEEYGGNLIPNLWNNRKQVTLHVEGEGTVRIRTTRFVGAETKRGNLKDIFSKIQNALPFGEHGRPLHCVKAPSFSPMRQTVDAFRFDCWINQVDGGGAFNDNMDPMHIAEPAIFPHVIGVGLEKGIYSPDQNEIGAKPNFLIEGDGPISFRLPEIASEIANLLAEDPSLDMVAICERIRASKAA